ncbi:MAG: hypothetical protein RLZZ539_1208, partial [Pseudomonadota bacterium]
EVITLWAGLALGKEALVRILLDETSSSEPVVVTVDATAGPPA